MSHPAASTSDCGSPLGDIDFVFSNTSVSCMQEDETRSLVLRDCVALGLIEDSSASDDVVPFPAVTPEPHHATLRYFLNNGSQQHHISRPYK
jgi:hypothetical protein